MRLLTKKTEATTVATLARLVENLQWSLRLIEHYERRLADLEAQLTRERAIREAPCLSKYVC